MDTIDLLNMKVKEVMSTDLIIAYEDTILKEVNNILNVKIFIIFR